MDKFTKTYLKIITESQHLKQKIQDVTDSIKKAQHFNKKKEVDQTIISTLGQNKFRTFTNELTTIANDINNALQLKDEQRFNLATVFTNYLKYGGFVGDDKLIKRINKRLNSQSEKWTRQWNKGLYDDNSTSEIDLKELGIITKKKKLNQYLNVCVGKCTRLDYLRAIYKENESLFENITSVNKLLGILYRAALRVKEPKFEYKEGDTVQNVLFNYTPNTIPATGKGQVYLILKYGLSLTKEKNVDLCYKNGKDGVVEKYYEVKNILGKTAATIHCELDKKEGIFLGLGLNYLDKSSYLLFTNDGIKNIKAEDLANYLGNYKLLNIKGRKDPVQYFYPIKENSIIQTNEKGQVTNIDEIKDPKKIVFRWSLQSHFGIEINSEIITELIKQIEENKDQNKNNKKPQV